MGFLAKKATEKMAAAATGPIGFDAGEARWHTAGRPIAAAIIHEAALGLDLKNKYSNVHRPGRQKMLAGAVAGAMTSVDTTLWLNEVGSRRWQVFLGVATLDGRISKDWLCEVRVGPTDVQSDESEPPPRRPDSSTYRHCPRVRHGTCDWGAAY
jgi:hypothetical protein